MDTAQMTKMLDDLRFVRAQAEFNAVLASLNGNKDECLESLLRHREQLLADKQHYELTSSLEKYQTSKVEDVLERSLRERLDAAKHILVSRQIKDIEARLEILDACLDKYSLES
jgi:DNA-binding response OmpR family regulator